MNIYLLDTNIISEPSKPAKNDKVIGKIEQNIDFSCISSITWGEVLSGIKCLSKGAKREALQEYYVNQVQKIFDIIPFDTSAAAVYSDLVERLRDKGTPAPKFDMMIAATAIANNLILVTRNTADFKAIADVSTLMLENWFEEK
ncbi:MAG: PIN domain-containing protein [Spirochaetia bacterium]|nr:PIN domain-containing protein [Spirochaetia bacterium]